MANRRRAGRWGAVMLGATILAGVAFGVTAWVRYGGFGSAPVAFDDKTPLPELIKGLQAGDTPALLLAFPKVVAKTGPGATAADPTEGETLVESLKAMRTGFARFGNFGRASALKLVTKILERFSVDPAPACWANALRPMHDLFAAGLADPDAATRITALDEVGRLWSWFPGRSMIPLEEDTLFGWKEALFAPVLRRLTDREPASRAAAVACLGNLPDDHAALPALAYLEDKSEGGSVVRKQVLASFARRPTLLTEDMILKRLHDSEPDIVEIAELILSTRGLSRDQIELGRLIFDPKPEHRARVIARLRDRTDIDPVVWLIQLSHDSDENIRAGAVATLIERAGTNPDAIQRVDEMASSDPSSAVRQAAARRVGADNRTGTATVGSLPIPMPKPRHPGAAAAGSLSASPETTVSLPPLPGSPSLNPRAN